MVEATGSEMRLWGSLEWRHLFTKFHGNPPIGSKVIRGQTDRRTDKLVILQACFHFILLEVG
jgi:hypothetical protein